MRVVQRRGRDRKNEIGEERKRSSLENLVVAWNMADPWIKPSMYIQICVHVYKIHLRKLRFYWSSCFGKYCLLLRVRENWTLLQTNMFSLYGRIGWWDLGRFSEQLFLTEFVSCFSFLNFSSFISLCSIYCTIYVFVDRWKCCYACLFYIIFPSVDW